MTLTAAELLAVLADEVPTEQEGFDRKRAYRTVLARIQRRAWAGESQPPIDLTDPLGDDLRDEFDWISDKAIADGAGLLRWRQDSGLFCTRRMATLLGCPNEDELLELADVLARIHHSDQEQVAERLDRAWHTCDPSEEFLVRAVAEDGHLLILRCMIQVLLAEDGKPDSVVLSAEDVTEAEALRRELEQEKRRVQIGMTAASRMGLDALTGLANRQRFAVEVQDAARSGPGCVLLVSVSGVRKVNQSQGTAAGDRWIVGVASILQKLAISRRVGRISGTDFAVLLPDLTPAEAMLLEAAIGKEFAGGLLQGAVSHRSVVMHFRPGLHDGKDLLADAELGLYEAKETGQQLIAIAAGESVSERRRLWDERFQTALLHERFALRFQPILDLATNRVAAYEALIRLHELDDVVCPDSFVPTLERLGLIGQLDRLVVTRALDNLHRIPDNANLHVNISGQSFCDGEFAEFVQRSLTKYPLRGRLTFEVTETAIIQRPWDARAFVDRLHAYGCRVAIDDFGAGNWTVHDLLSLPVDIAKIDGSVINCLDRERTAVERVVDLLRGQGARTVAEFVENQQTLDLVREIGIDYAQGFHIGRPTETLPTETLSSEGLTRKATTGEAIGRISSS